MSRSYRKTPIIGLTSKPSDKTFKKAEHKRARRALSARDLSIEEPPADKKFGDPWSSPKDGKRWIGRNRCPELMRK